MAVVTMASQSRVFLGIKTIKDDSYKNGSNEGLMERLWLSAAGDFDANVGPLINNFIPNVVDPTTMAVSLLSYAEIAAGGVPFVSSDTYLRRKVLRFITNINKIRGTFNGYYYLFQLLGLGATITEVFDYTSLDEGVHFDSADTFDSGPCSIGCSPYSIALTGSGSLTPEQISNIFSIIAYNQPINADLTDITYNGGELVRVAITVEIDSNGDLTYNNSYDPSLVLTIDGAGDLIVSGSIYASNYSIDGNGNLIFTI